MSNTEREPKVGDHYRRTHYGQPYGATWVLIARNINGSESKYLVNTQTGESELMMDYRDYEYYRRVEETERDLLKRLAASRRREYINLGSILDEFDDVDQP